LLLESNHDSEMLRNGRYPKILKDRIAGSHGHLSNADAGELIAQIVSDKLHTVYLGHLSEENNRPLIALDTVEKILRAHGKRMPLLHVAPRDGISEITILS
jgi:phosphoribosyl 1,2-cyclic phosphodiesterase